jgi:hypothetical protein
MITAFRGDVLPLENGEVFLSLKNRLPTIAVTF